MSGGARRRRILCIGMPVRDLTFRIDSLPAHGAKKRAEHFEEICGGNAVNAAIGIARLGGRAALTGPMGDRSEASYRFIIDQIAREAIDGSSLVPMPGLTTPVSAVMIDQSGERTIVTFRDPRLWQVQLPDADAVLRDCDAILIENRCAPFGTELCRAAQVRGIPVVVDIDRPMALDDALLTVASHLVFSIDALRATAAVRDDADALRKLARLTPAFLAGTSGPQGTIWLDRRGEVRETPAFKVEAVDTLGAGDIFHGAFALAITEQQDIPDALSFASAAAALKCTRFGGAFGSPRRDEVEQFLRTQSAAS
jgi:sugar/nucleoside kinase (ribokinase family)